MGKVKVDDGVVKALDKGQRVFQMIALAGAIIIGVALFVLAKFGFISEVFLPGKLFWGIVAGWYAIVIVIGMNYYMEMNSIPSDFGKEKKPKNEVAKVFRSRSNEEVHNEHDEYYVRKLPFFGLFYKPKGGK